MFDMVIMKSGDTVLEIPSNMYDLFKRHHQSNSYLYWRELPVINMSYADFVVLRDEYERLSNCPDVQVTFV